ncbi:hypothetical protein COC69_05660 [Bacillus cereus]|uniref:Uncharacterized protein n=1 Tax=Bacillus cereus TaxID=1396 RepID=A0A9X7CQM4_BACCE|nr:hypothetical protein [Bacillus cereus]PGS81617.1 hypothetical protein COC69_05660 [Bacillus cereus]
MSDKKRKAVYDYEAIKRSREKLTDEEKAEKNRRDKFVRARSFITNKLYTEEEFKELYALMIEHKEGNYGTKK